MAWKPRPRGIVETPIAPMASLTTKDLLVLVEQQIRHLIRSGHRSATFRIFAVQFGLPSGDCGLPGCGEAFLKIPENKEFCCPDHKIEFNNKHRR